MTRARAIAIAAVLVGSALWGCAVDPAAEVATYRAVLDAHAPSVVNDAGAPGAPGGGGAYNADRPLTLTGALALANAHNERLSLAGEDYLQALIDKDRAAAVFLPTVSLAPTYTLRDQTRMGGDNQLIHQFFRERALDVPVQLSLDANPARGLAGLGYSDARADAARADLLALQERVLLDVARTFYGVLTAQARARVLMRSVAVQARRVRDMQSLAHAGLARPLDVAQSRSRAAGTRVELVAAREAAQTGRAVLARLIGVPRVDGPLTADMRTPDDLPSLDALMALADRQRQDLAAAAARVASASAALDAAWREYFPSVSLDLSWFARRETFPPDVGWASVLEVDLPLFSAGLIRADIREAWSRLRQAKLVQSLRRRQVREQVTVARDRWASTRRRIEELRVQAHAAQEATDLADASFEVGMATNLERLVAQDDLLTARLHLATARYQETIHYLELLRAVGRMDFPALTAPAVALAPSDAAPHTRPSQRTSK